MSRNWPQVPRPPGPRELHDIRLAASDLAQQAGHAPGRTGALLRKVADGAIIFTAMAGAFVAAFHLLKPLFHWSRHAQSPASDPGQAPPRRPRMVATAYDESNDRHRDPEYHRRRHRSTQPAGERTR